MPSKVDGGLRAELIRGLKPFGFHCQAIETGGTGLGVPDMNICAKGVESWIECKFTKAWSVSHISPEQIGWILQRERCGGNTYVAVRRKKSASARLKAYDELWLIDGANVVQLQEVGLRKMPMVLGIWSGGPKGWDWEAIANTLLNH